MLLAIDVGNTNLTLGLYESDTLGPRWRLATDHERMPDEYGLQFVGLLSHAGIQKSDISGICLASVVPPLTSRIVQACKTYLSREPLVVDAGVKTGVRVRYEDPKAVGADRIADAAAVKELYGGPACVVDFGTATTFCVVTEKGEYMGGAIMPGPGLSANSLAEKTARLPGVELKSPVNIIGRDTPENILTGIVLGHAGAVERIVREISKELRNDQLQYRS